MNVFLTGPRQIGKSTAVRRYLAGCGLHYGGFFTVWGPDDRLHLLRAADPGAKMTAATAVARRANSRVQAEAAAFDHLGCQALEAPAQLLVLDELGFLERDAAAFRRRIQQVLDGPTPVLGVVRQVGSLFLPALQARADTVVLTVTLENRDAIPALLCQYLPKGAPQQ